MATCKDCFHWNACKKMLEAMWGHSVPSGYEGGADRCEDFISAADIAPRAEVAREIIEDVATLIEEHWSEIQHGVYWLVCGRCIPLRELLKTVEKKYTEGQK